MRRLARARDYLPCGAGPGRSRRASPSLSRALSTPPSLTSPPWGLVLGCECSECVPRSVMGASPSLPCVRLLSSAFAWTERYSHQLITVHTNAGVCTHKGFRSIRVSSDPEPESAHQFRSSDAKVAKAERRKVKAAGGCGSLKSEVLIQACEQALCASCAPV